MSASRLMLNQSKCKLMRLHVAARLWDTATNTIPFTSMLSSALCPNAAALIAFCLIYLDPSSMAFYWLLPTMALTTFFLFLPSF